MRTIFVLLAFALASAAATYTLRPGDTLGVIARDHHTTVAALVAANGIKNPDRVYAGEQLVIPGAVPGPAMQLISVSKYVVRAGDTLGSIATAQHVSVAALGKANALRDPNRISVGQPLVIPGSRAKVATWVCPVAGRPRFSDDFGAPRAGGHLHMGIDLLASRGTPVVATVPGMLVRHDNTKGGHAYYLHGDDGRTYYGAHLATFVRGDGHVAIGETIGTVGDSGDAHGGPTHLHFEVADGKVNKDPYTLLKRACP
ncbi:MAG: hypothetical protein QOI47_1077 [Actinomycetota bacterium]|nr:hypothetical protein [Actinomycetota bacterium]